MGSSAPVVPVPVIAAAEAAGRMSENRRAAAVRTEAAKAVRLLL